MLEETTENTLAKADHYMTTGLLLAAFKGFKEIRNKQGMERLAKKAEEINSLHVMYLANHELGIDYKAEMAMSRLELARDQGSIEILLEKLFAKRIEAGLDEYCQSKSSKKLREASWLRNHLALHAVYSVLIGHDSVVAILPEAFHTAYLCDLFAVDVYTGEKTKSGNFVWLPGQDLPKELGNPICLVEEYSPKTLTGLENALKRKGVKYPLIYTNKMGVGKPGERFRSLLASQGFPLHVPPFRVITPETLHLQGLGKTVQIFDELLPKIEGKHYS